MQIHKTRFAANNFILCGDLNSNVIWDRADRWWNHSDVVRELEEINIHSIYHIKTGEAQGQEKQRTYFMYRNVEKSYHIDYFFLSNDLISNGSLEVGNIEEWIHCSDHVPLILETEG